MPVYTWRPDEKRLYLHVAFQNAQAVERGIMMPALKHMTEADARPLWQWLKAIATRPMPPYAGASKAATP